MSQDKMSDKEEANSCNFDDIFSGSQKPSISLDCSYLDDDAEFFLTRSLLTMMKMVKLNIQSGSFLHPQAGKSRGKYFSLFPDMGCSDIMTSLQGGG